MEEEKGARLLDTKPPISGFLFGNFSFGFFLLGFVWDRLSLIMSQEICNADSQRKLPSTSLHALIVLKSTQLTPSPQIIRIHKMLRYETSFLFQPWTIFFIFQINGGSREMVPCPACHFYLSMKAAINAERWKWRNFFRLLLSNSTIVQCFQSSAK